MFGNVSIMRVQNTHFTTVTMLTTARALPQYNRRSNFLDRLAMDPADHAIVRMAPDFFEDAGDPIDEIAKMHTWSTRVLARHGALVMLITGDCTHTFAGDAGPTAVEFIAITGDSTVHFFRETDNRYEARTMAF